MTQNQIAYLNYAENARHNKANEGLDKEKNDIGWENAAISKDKNAIAREQIASNEKMAKWKIGSDTANNIFSSIAGMFSMKKVL